MDAVSKSGHKGPRIKSYAGWLFLLTVAAGYAVTGSLAPEVAIQAMSALMKLLGRMLPIVGLVFVFLFLANLFLERKWVAGHLGKAAGPGGWGLTIVCGVLSMGPLYAWYPLLRELKEKGMSPSLMAAFLYSRALKLPLLPLMIHYFGTGYTIMLSACIVIFALISGALTGAAIDD